MDRSLLHGILGSGGNWRGIARKLTERRPEWGVMLVDLRQHGRSEHGEPPNTIAACADDVHALVDELGSVTAIAGHSFGGKVALATRALRAACARPGCSTASPGARPDRASDSSETVAQLIALMERLPRTWAKREDFVDAVVAAGHPKPLAQWLAMNVVAGDGPATRCASTSPRSARWSPTTSRRICGRPRSTAHSASSSS